MSEFDGNTEYPAGGSGDNARVSGVLLMLASIIGLFFAWNMETTIGVLGGETHNIGLMQNRELAVHAGFIVFLAGVVLLAAGMIIEEIGSKNSSKSGE